jgi:hypothetical protein
MNGEQALGGFYLLVIVVVFFSIVGLGARAMVGGWRKVEQFDRHRAIERNVRNAVNDADYQQRVARKLLDEYDR